MHKFSKKCIPLAFFAIHQHHDVKQAQKSTIWNDVFDDITSGTEYAIKANINEILAILKIALESQSWKMRIQASYTISTIATKLQSQIEKDILDELLKMLLSSLTGRTWSGKVTF